MICALDTIDVRKLFWATQPETCGTAPDCGASCGQPGLELQPDGTIATGGWLRSLILNMLLTDGRLPDTDCGYRPGGQMGHWSESYVLGDIGSLLRTAHSTGTIAETITALRANAEATLARLVSRAVAVKVEVDVAYLGNMRFSLDITVFGSTSKARVGLTGSRLDNSWIWEELL